MTASDGGPPTLKQLAVRLRAVEERAERSESVLSVMALKARYADLVDRRFSAGRTVDAETMARVTAEIADLFTLDGCWDGGAVLGRAVGREAIAERLSRPTLTFARHLFVKPQIAVDGDHATGVWDILCPCRTPDGTSWWMCGVEEDEYRRVDGEWLHRSMRLTTVFMSKVGTGWTRIFH